MVGNYRGWTVDIVVLKMGSNSLKDYLKRYESNTEVEKKKKKKQKKRSQPQTTRGVKTGQPDPFWPGPILARIKRAGPGWPDMVKRATFLGPARGLASWRAGGLARQFFLICILFGPISQILILNFFTSVQQQWSIITTQKQPWNAIYNNIIDSVKKE